MTADLSNVSHSISNFTESVGQITDQLTANKNNKKKKISKQIEESTTKSVKIVLSDLKTILSKLNTQHILSIKEGKKLDPRLEELKNAVDDLYLNVFPHLSKEKEFSDDIKEIENVFYSKDLKNLLARTHLLKTTPSKILSSNWNVRDRFGDRSDKKSTEKTSTDEKKAIMTDKEITTLQAIENLDNIFSDLREDEMKNLIDARNYDLSKKYPYISLSPKLQAIKNAADYLLGEVIPSIKTPLYQSDYKMPKSVQNYWSPKLGFYRTMKKGHDNITSAVIKNHPSEKFYNEESRLLRKMAKSQLALNLGVGLKINSKGQTGTHILTDVNGKAIGVAKFSSEYVSLKVQVLNFFKSYFGQLHFLSKKSPMDQPRSERAAYIVSRELGFNLAPPSEETKFNRKSAVFQIFIKKEKNIDANVTHNVKQAEEEIKNTPPQFYKEFSKIPDNIKKKQEFSENEKTEFQKFAIYDFLIGNLDRHEENWFVTLNDKQEITHIKAIDNANAFPKKQPSKTDHAARNQYKWKELNIAKGKFTEDTIKFVQEHLTEENIDKVIQAINKEIVKTKKREKFLDGEMIALFKQRADLIRSVVNSTSTPKDLASYSDIS